MEDIIFVKRTNKTGNCRTYNNRGLAKAENLTPARLEALVNGG